MDDVVKLFNVFGLSDKEAKILHACMRAEGIRASDISKKTGIERTNVYKIIETLISRGFITMYKLKSITFYRSLDPKSLLGMLKENANEFEKKLELLESGYNSESRLPKIELFSGRSAVSSAIKNIIKKNNDYVCFGGVEQAYKQNYFENLPAGLLAEENKVRGRVILSPKEKAVILSTELYRVSNKELPKNVCTVICDDLVAIFNWGDNCNVVFIQDKKIANDYLLLFENLWINSRSLNKSELSKISMSNLRFKLE